MLRSGRPGSSPGSGAKSINRMQRRGRSLAPIWGMGRSPAYRRRDGGSIRLCVSAGAGLCGRVVRSKIRADM